MKLLMFIVSVLFTNLLYSQTLHLYGGKNHDVYLGCLNCSSYDSSSIWNSYGTYGSKYNSNSIWNQYGMYGNSYNSDSPWNNYGSNPPVVVDKDGGFYGYFTVDKYKSKRFTSKLGLIIYEYYEDIREDVRTWNKKIFE